MPTYPLERFARRLSTRRILVPLVLAGAVATASAFAYTRTATYLLGRSVAATPDDPLGEPPANGLKTLIVYATPMGMQPARFDIPPGAKKLMIRNVTNMDSLTFTVTRPGRDEILSTTADNGHNAVAIVPFVPGETVITEASNPHLRCVISVEE